MKKKQVKKDKITGLRFDPGWLYTGVYRGKRVLLQVYGCGRWLTHAAGGTQRR